MPCLTGLPHARLLPLSALIPSSVVTRGFFLFLESARVLQSLDLCTGHSCLQNSSSSPASLINVLHTAARGRLLQSEWSQLPRSLPKATHVTGLYRTSKTLHNLASVASMASSFCHCLLSHLHFSTSLK